MHSNYIMNKLAFCKKKHELFFQFKFLMILEDNVKQLTLPFYVITLTETLLGDRLTGASNFDI